MGSVDSGSMMSGGMLGRRGSVKRGGNKNQAAFSPKHGISNFMRILYHPQNVVGSFCQYAFAPPLDVLKRGPEVKRDEYGGANKKNKEDSDKAKGKGSDVKNATGIAGAGAGAGAGPGAGANDEQGGGNGEKGKGRTTRWWICITEQKIFFYQFYGDSDPRFIADVSNAMSYVGRDGVSTVSVTFPDRIWVIDFDEKSHAHRFHFALEEGKRAAAGASIIIKKQDILGKTHALAKLGHTQNLWRFQS